MKWKGCGRKRLRPNIKNYSGICLEGSEGIHENPVRIAGLRVEI
jgi:hypothetical protein